MQEGKLVFTSDNQDLPWTVDLRDARHRDYMYGYTIIYKDGVIKNVPETGGWLKGEPGFITVGEKYTLEVDVYPTLLTFPEHAKLVQVDLAYEDQANGVSETGSFVFNAQANTKGTWRVKGVLGGPKRYRYEIKYFSGAGTVTALPAQNAEAEALVVPPAPAPPPP